MKVHEVIEALKKLPQDAECEDADMRPIKYIAKDQSSDEEGGECVVIICY